VQRLSECETEDDLYEVLLMKEAFMEKYAEYMPHHASQLHNDQMRLLKKTSLIESKEIDMKDKSVLPT